MVKFSNGRHTYVGPGEWAQETEASARHQQGLRHREQQHGADLERLALELAERKDALDNADFERALRQRALDARIEDEDADRALRTRALDETAASRAKDDARFDARDAQDAKARDSMSRALGVLGGGGRSGTAPRNSVEAPSAPVYPPMDGRGPLKAQAPAMTDSDGDGTPDALETDDYDAETERMSGALTPFLKDIDPADQARIFGALEGRRAQGRNKLRAQQINAKAVKLAKNGLLDQTKLVDLQTALAQGADPEKVDAALTDYAEAAQTEFADGLQRQSAMQEATQTWEQMQALGLRLSPATRANVAALAARIANPLTSGKDAMRYAEEIRKAAFKDAAGETEKPWHENPAVAAILKDTGLPLAQRMKDAQELAAALGLQGAQPAAPQAGGGGGQAPTQPAARGDVSVRVSLRDELGREPTPEELAAKLKEAETAQPAAPPLYGSQQEEIEAAIGKPPSLYPPLPSGSGATESRSRFQQRTGHRGQTLRDVALSAGAKEVDRDEPGQYTEAEARRMQKEDPRLQFKKRPKGGYDIVSSNDLSRSSDRKGSTVNQ